MSVLVPVRNEERHIRADGRRHAGPALRTAWSSCCSPMAARGTHARDPARARRRGSADQGARQPPSRTASGLNVCLREARGRFVARMDAHTYYADCYLAAGVERLRRGDTEWVSGPAIPRPAAGLARRGRGACVVARPGRLAQVERGPRRAPERELDTRRVRGFGAASACSRAGGWDERWPINQDSEMASRFLREGAGPRQRWPATTSRATR